MKLQQLLSLLRKALDDYKMIEENDSIAVGLSGGKDSMALLYALKALQRFYPKKFALTAITVDPGFENFDTQKMSDFCKELEIPYIVVNTQIAQIVFETRKESNPCSLCAKMRKGAINEALKEAGIKKIAYAHHKDDFIETALMSALFQGEFDTFAPVTFLDRTDITMIRPFLYVREADIKGFCNKYDIPIAKSPCPVDGQTKREYVKSLIKQLNQEHPGIKESLYSAAIKLYPRE